MVDFADEDLDGVRFERVRMRRATFEQVDLSGSFLRNVYLTGARLRGAWLEDVDVDGVVRGLTVNGVDVGPLVEAELDRRDPERRLVDPTDADGFRAAWEAVTRRWEATVARARALPPDLLDERVDHEWSFLETLRHLVFCTDAWVLRAVLGDPSPYSPLGLPHDELEAGTPVPVDPDAHPGLDEVLAVRSDRVERVTRVMSGLTDARLAGTTAPVPERGYPESQAFPLARCLGAVVHEEWLHRQYAERDLAVLEAREARDARDATQAHEAPGST